MQLYYLDDFSLGEIAEEYGVSRQAVYDNVRRTEAMLEDYEQKLQLFEKFQHRLAIVNELLALVEGDNSKENQIRQLLEALKDHE